MSSLLPTLPIPAAYARLVSILHVLLALVASGHIILTKREVRAAIGWLGLVWLSPFLGVTLYVFFGINRIRRKAVTLRKHQRRSRRAGGEDAAGEKIANALDGCAAHLLPLVGYMGRLTHRPLSPGNAVEMLVNGDEAYPAMLEAIDRATRSVGISSYIFNADSVGMRFVEALGRARRRGVEVRVLVDAVGARYHRPSIFGPLREAGVRAEAFLPSIIPAYFPYFNLRCHRKVLVIDGREGFTGGMNIDESFYSPSHPKELRHDLHFRLNGPVVDTMRQVFADDWAFRTGEVLDDAAWSSEAREAGPALARGIIDGPDANMDQLSFSYLGALNCARDSVAIVTPYFLPEDPLSAALQAAAMRGVAVDIFVPEQNNLALVQWASTAFLGPLLDHGCRVWAVAPPFDHSKLMLVDRAWSFFGSGNWDPRSLRLNFEFNVECYDRSLAQRLNEQVESRRARARLITKETLDARSLVVRLRDGTARLLSPYL